MRIYAGTSGFGYDEWKGNFYPEKISGAKMLSYYSTRLQTVEINNTFYRMPTPAVVNSWVKQVPPGFLFTVKAPRIITHIKRLQYVDEECGFFFNSISGLKKNLGCVLFQFPASFRDDQKRLKDFLKLIPAKIPCSFDFRSATWHNPGTYALLKKRDFSLCMEDTDESPVKKIISTAKWGYLRMRGLDYGVKELKQWAKKINAQKWKKAFIFFKHEDDSAARGPELAELFRRMSEKKPQ